LGWALRRPYKKTVKRDERPIGRRALTTETSAEGALKRALITLLCGSLSIGCGFDEVELSTARPDFFDPNAAGMEESQVLPAVDTALEAPAPLTEAAPPAWLSGRALASSATELFVVDRANGTLDILDREQLTEQVTIALGTTPEQLVVGPDGTAWITVRGAGHVARVDPEG
jgi:hypothetical protein